MIRPLRAAVSAGIVAAAAVAGVLVPVAGSPVLAQISEQRLDPAPAPSVVPAATAPAPARTAASRPLAGIRIALDPGHQLGNHNFPSRIHRPVPAGGFSKPCNTTGTATNGGYPEATAVFKVTRLVAARLRSLGASVVLTRTRNSESLWGPCVDARGRFGARAGARLLVSLHADGAAASGHGFHVIAPTARSPWTTDIAAPSLRLAESLRSGLDERGLVRSTYLAGGRGLTIRSDLATLNLADVPTAMVELGNMRNSGDARRLTTSAGQTRYANALVRGIRSYLKR
ncbi:N-acetylmuramoyl-L-alanine amidase [Marmoricola sp. RAF53]|uniref:N-acetylmuramoyl-L-alanine amidase n=1 Tax=Marmoricola sp. RAF53 TaxID=3233059 RepID=UPI003F9E47A2